MTTGGLDNTATSPARIDTHKGDSEAPALEPESRDEVRPTRSSRGIVDGRMGQGFDELSTARGDEGLRVFDRSGMPAARLVVLSGSGPGRKIKVDRDLMIGRSTRADISLDDGLASRRHASIRVGGEGRFLIEDLGSRNGTHVNGAQIRSQALRFGDRVRVGGTLFLFTHHDPLEEQVEQRQRLEAIGRLGTGIAHDFNNLLSAITSTMEYLEGLPPGVTLGDDDVQDCMHDVRIAAKRATEMTRRLLGFARHRPGSLGSVALDGLCTEIVQLIRRTVNRGIEIQLDVEPNLIVSGDRSSLHQLLLNLCLNARDAMPSGGTLTIRLGRADAETLDAMPMDRSDDITFALLEVVDTGMGMDAETAARIFEPFFTTKSSQAGAGLGLSTVYEVAASHGGHVDVVTAPGAGARFRVVLPLALTLEEGTVSVTNVSAEVLDESVAQPRVLLVDDEDVVRRGGRRVLRRMGYEVDEVRDGDEALERYGADPSRYGIVLLDLNMPGRSGRETFMALRELDPEVFVVVVSGYWDDALENELRAHGVCGFVQKPYDASALHRAIQRAHSEGSSPAPSA